MNLCILKHMAVTKFLCNGSSECCISLHSQFLAEHNRTSIGKVNQSNHSCQQNDSSTQCPNFDPFESLLRLCMHYVPHIVHLALDYQYMGVCVGFSFYF